MAYYNITSTENGMRYMSGLLVLDERVVFGRPVIGYLNAAGQIWNEQHLGENKYKPVGAHLEQKQCMQTFRLSVNGEQITCGWKTRRTSAVDTTAILELEHVTLPLKVELVTNASGEDWLARSLRITNTGDKFLSIDELAPFAGVPWLHTLEQGLTSYSVQEILAESSSAIFEVGYNVDTRFVHEGDFQFVPIEETEMQIGSGMHGRSGWSRPAIVLRDNLNGSLFCAELAYSGNWCAQFKPNLSPHSTFVDFSLGMDCPVGQALRVLAPGETIETPKVHFTLCASGFDALVQSRHRYIRTCIMPKDAPEDCCLVEANHRGYLADHENEEDILADVEIAAQAGAEMYVIDAGWYGKEPNVWFDNVGDWYSGAWLKNDLYPIINKVHEKRMKFGLWMELEAIGCNSALREKYPDWIMQNNVSCPADGRALDLSNPAVAEWVYEQAADLISRYSLDMFRIDHNHRIGNGVAKTVGPFVENNIWRYYENLYTILEKLRDQFPQVSFQNCAAGGGRLDFGILRFFNHSELSDWMHAPRVQRIFNGTSLQLPPETLLQCFGTEVSEQVMKGDLLFQLHSVLASRFILRGIAPTEELRNDELQQQIKRILTLYKAQLRPVLRSNCLIYHHTLPTDGILSPKAWLAYELSNPQKTSGYALIFRLGNAETPNFTLKPQKISMKKTYRVTLDRANNEVDISGYQLHENGITVSLDQHFSSELIYWREIQ